MLAVIVAAYQFRMAVFGVDAPVRLACGGALVLTGWSLARDLSHAMGSRAS